MILFTERDPLAFLEELVKEDSQEMLVHQDLKEDQEILA